MNDKIKAFLDEVRDVCLKHNGQIYYHAGAVAVDGTAVSGSATISGAQVIVMEHDHSTCSGETIDAPEVARLAPSG